MVSKGLKVVIAGVRSDNAQELLYVVLTLSVLIYMLCTIIAFLTCHTACKSNININSNSHYT